MQPSVPQSDEDPTWWKTGVVYQIYPRSFTDTTGDGVGDLEGITSHLDHLSGGPSSLGVDAIWLSPIYPSPGHDLGYAISDYASVDPLFGTEADFDRLVAEAHRRGLKVLLDLVVNHTSDVHPWFTASRRSRAGPYANRYLWGDPAGTDRSGRPIPPNNWVSFFGGPGWEWDPIRGQFYEHTFLEQQPDLNWRDPGTRADVTAMMRGWLARGVDGFRMDVFNAFLKDPQLRSNPVRRGRSAWTRQLHLHDKDQPDLPALLAELRAVVDQAPGRMTVGELFDGDVGRAARLSAERHLVFDFELLQAGWSAAAMGRALDRREAAYGPDRWPTVVLSNHDQPRYVSRWGTGLDRDALARAAAVLLLTLRGTPFLYYGEELGVPGIVVPNEDAIDPPARRAGPDFAWWNRDQARAPMPWTGDPGASFTTSRPWLPLSPDAATRNVAAQRADPRSVLAFYRALLALRRATPALHAGAYARVAMRTPGVLAFWRRTADSRALVVLNLGRRDLTATLSPDIAAEPWDPTLGTHGSSPPGIARSGRINLRALEGVILVALDAHAGRACRLPTA
jgi:alpha-glucosidase